MKLVKSEPSNSDFGWIGRGIEVKGDITFADRLQVDGKSIGKLTSDSGTLIIGESGQIEAQIDVGVCVVHGTVQGNLIARSKLEIRRTGRRLQPGLRTMGWQDRARGSRNLRARAMGR